MHVTTDDWKERSFMSEAGALAPSISKPHARKVEAVGSGTYPKHLARLRSPVDWPISCLCLITTLAPSPVLPLLLASASQRRPPASDRRTSCHAPAASSFS